ncbi:putative pilin/flagellin [Methanonatronarchaeum thermophilum]|uniref:Putative pilin/flagellin n=1 Tax=Methanonatronarchaeum thermophilum TaxID=1927129 RepID=A0A1Y3GAW6_9EURY|nr:Ig-like domain-containing protein [Methanonatronarchaeum thermophilum]OUJ18390.1 putative pilin/flagellin [Methanonatronarchaeum thermophilum]
MKYLLDEKGQAEIIGVILIISIIVIAFSLIQSGMVPQWNQEIEFNHYQDVNDDIQKLHNVMERVAAQGHSESAEIQLGTTYPERGPLINPPPAQGTLQTYDTQITINNATAKQTDAQCYWNGTEKSFNTQGLMYTPNYNYQEGTPPIHIEHNTLITAYPENPEIQKQNLITGDKINQILLKGQHEKTGYEKTGYTLESLGIYPKSAPPNTVAMESTEQENIEITLQTKLPQAYEELNETETVESVNITDHQEVTITLTKEETFYFKTTALSLDEDATPEPEYIMTYDHDRNNTAPTTIEVEVRDQYNNPLPGQKVNFTTGDITQNDLDDEVKIYNEYTKTDERGIAKTLVTVDQQENVDAVIPIISQLSPYAGNCSWTYNNIIIGNPDLDEIDEPEPPVDWELKIEEMDIQNANSFTLTLSHTKDEGIDKDTPVYITIENGGGWEEETYTFENITVEDFSNEDFPNEEWESGMEISKDFDDDYDFVDNNNMKNIEIISVEIKGVADSWSDNDF